MICMSGLMLHLAPSGAFRLTGTANSDLLRTQLDPTEYLLSPLPGKPTNEIPRILHQTTELRPDCIPDLTAGFRDGFERRVVNDSAAREFLTAYFTPSVARAFDQLKGPHRADLWRYATLYVFGGVYADIKVMPTVQLASIFKSDPDKFTFYSTTSSGAISPGREPTVFNGLMASPPRNPHHLRMVAWITEHAPPSHYQLYCAHEARLLWLAVKMKLSNHTGGWEFLPGAYEKGDYRFVLLDEDCSSSLAGDKAECRFVGPSKDSLCCNIYASQPQGAGRRMVAHTRDPDYPHGERWAKCAARSSETRPGADADPLRQRGQ